MSMATVQRQDDVSLFLTGELTFNTVLSVRTQLETQLSGVSQSQTLDFSGVTRADSSLLSLWLCAQRFVRSNGMQISAVGLPDSVQSLAQMVGLHFEN